MSLYEIYFSPTGGTKKVADIVADGIGESAIKLYIAFITIKDACMTYG